MASHADVVIVGGGIIGLTTGYFLAREGVRVRILDRGDFGREASWAGAGILPPVDLATARTPYEQLRAHSIQLLTVLSRELREQVGVDNGYLRCGGLVISEEGGAAEEEWCPEGARCLSITRERLGALEPALSPRFAHGFELPDVAQLRNPRHLKALLAGCQRLGVALQPGCPIHGFERSGGRISAVKSVGGTVPGGHFVIATGAWTDPLLEPLGWRPGIHPVRGQIALLDTGRPLLRRVLMWGERYLVPRPDGRVLVGSTQEYVGFDKRTTATAISELLTVASALVPALGAAQVERCWAGLRPGSPDGLPYLGPVPGSENLVVAAGHFRTGIQLSAGSALLVKEHLLGQPTTLPLEPFRMDRAPSPGATMPPPRPRPTSPS
jgi:glycine oxidase